MLGTQIGSYRIVSKLGEGGMGAVYLAEHQLLQRKVAVKVLLEELNGDPSIARRFINEARATSQIVHPGIVRVLDFGQLADKTTYMLMELLEGETLRERMQRRGRMPLDPALALVRQLAEALAAAHAQRVVHRDLKPENIFLVNDATAAFGVQGKILDFGIAKILDPGLDAPQTKAGSIIGTPLYMSPEQCLAQPNVDHRADLYALGGIFFFLLCARPPFQKGSFAEHLAAHIHQAPPAPSSLVPEVPAWVDAIVLRLLAKSPADRYQSSAELLDAIAAGRNSSPTTRRLAPEESTVIGSQKAIAAQLGAVAAAGAQPSVLTPSPPPLVTPAGEVAATVADAVTPMPGSDATPAPGGNGTRGTSPESQLALTRAHSAGDLAIPQPHRSSVSIFVLLGGAFASTIVLGLGGFYLLSRHRAAATVEEPARPSTVRFTIDSDPPGAEVYSEGTQRCVTPCRLVEPSRPGQASWVVAKEGYDEQPLTLAADRDGSGHVTLHAQNSR